MGNKRKRTTKNTEEDLNGSSIDNEDENPFGFQAAKGYINPSTGLQGAFPGLEEYGMISLVGLQTMELTICVWLGRV